VDRSITLGSVRRVFGSNGREPEPTDAANQPDAALDPGRSGALGSGALGSPSLGSGPLGSGALGSGALGSGALGSGPRSTPGQGSATHGSGVSGAGPSAPAARFMSPSSQASEPPDVIAQIHRRMIQMFAIVEEAVAGATHALLTGDREQARALVANDVALDKLYVELQDLVRDRVVAGGIGPAETTWLLSVLSMVPELERSGDLAEHVAQRATRNLPAEIPARMRGYLEHMGEVACAMWRMAADSYAERLASSERIDLLDDEMDDLHVQFIAEIAEGSVPVAVAIELALLGRFYERLGDHAVNLTRRVPIRLEVRVPAAGD
jgi:phosphate transport system protein